ncbi:MAG TPA: sortase [Candidatus Saccharimonadales bacterium]|nr:sortase [Candidatus Saccharimonadales bacterium]
MKINSGRFWLYARIVSLNIAVAGMFFAVSQTPPATVLRQSISFSQISRQVQLIRSGVPTRIVINSLGMDLAVGTGSFDPSTGNWTIDDTKAYYADISVPTNDHNGTTLIYGHNRQSVFGALHTIQPGAEAVVYTNTGYTFHYIYQSMREVLPNDVSIFQANGKPELTLLTCSGGWDTYRSLYTFKLETVDRL